MEGFKNMGVDGDDFCGALSYLEDILFGVAMECEDDDFLNLLFMEDQLFAEWLDL